MQWQSLGTETKQLKMRRFVFSNIRLPDKVLDLEFGQGWALKGRKGQQTVLCLEGSLWVTQEGDIRDYVLEEGDAFLVTQPGLVLVRALKRSRIGYCEHLGAKPFNGRFKETVFN